RTGCKLAALDETGKLPDDAVVYPHGQKKAGDAKRKIEHLVRKHQIEVIAIGNGTGCRETEQLVADLIADLENRRLNPSVSVTTSTPTAPALPPPPPPAPQISLEGLPEAPPDLAYVIVIEAGASDYSASPVAREEFPTLDATTRGTISIGRRLQDPLAELVKIDPQHIGVGLYQHDVKPKHLKESLEAVIESCVNQVGVEVNTASVPLLRHVSGLNQLVARSVVEYRERNGPFESREHLLRVPGLGEKRYTQAAGFLKLPESPDPLDS